MTGASLGSDASVNAVGTVIGLASAGLMFVSEKMWYGEPLFQFEVKRAFYNALNNVAAQCGEPKAIHVNLVLPKKSQEPDIKSLMRYIAMLANEKTVEIAGGDTEVTENVLSPMVHFTAMGQYLPKRFDDEKTIAEAGDSIVIAGYTAASGTAAMVYLLWEELSGWFQESYLKKALELEEYMDQTHAAVSACRLGVRIMHDLSRGGIQSALWELSQKTGRGVEAILDHIPIRQETIELCERYRLNPYRLLSNGAMLMVTKDGEALSRYLQQEGIRAAVIGRLTDDHDKVLLKNDEKHYIEPPKGDQLYELLG